MSAGRFQKIVGYLFTVILGACLVLAWILTIPLAGCGHFLGKLYHKLGSRAHGFWHSYGTPPATRYPVRLDLD
jgi:hypothetical protein